MSTMFSVYVMEPKKDPPLRDSQRITKDWVNRSDYATAELQAKRELARIFGRWQGGRAVRMKPRGAKGLR